MSKVSEERAQTCITLYPSTNYTGSWIFFNIETKKRVRRSVYTWVVDTNLVRAMMNVFFRFREIVRAEIPPTVAAEVSPVVEDVGGLLGNIRTSDEVAELDASVEVSNEVPDQVAGQENTLALKKMSVKKVLCLIGKDTKEEILKEFRSLFIEKEAIQPVKRSSVTSDQRKQFLRSHMFLDEKHDGKGDFEKLKGRLVGDWSTQDRAPYKHLESPTKNIESVFMILELASRRKMRASKTDFTAVYLNAMIDESEKIMMWLTSEIATILVEEFPEIGKFVDNQGRLIVRIIKALYGLVQSAALWFTLIFGFLVELGFKSNWVSKCIMNLDQDGLILTIVLYVDDLLVLWYKEEDMHRLVKKLIERFT